MPIPVSASFDFGLSRPTDTTPTATPFESEEFAVQQVTALDVLLAAARAGEAAATRAGEARSQADVAMTGEWMSGYLHVRIHCCLGAQITLTSV